MSKQTKYQLQMAIGVFGSGAALYTVSHLYHDASYYKWLVLLAMAPLCFALVVIFRAMSEMDEMFSRIIVESMAFSGLATGFTCYAYLFLREIGAPQFQLQWVFVLMWGYFWLASLWIKRRYR
jgi:hypothetical protein